MKIKTVSYSPFIELHAVEYHSNDNSLPTPYIRPVTLNARYIHGITEITEYAWYKDECHRDVPYAGQLTEVRLDYTGRDVLSVLEDYESICKALGTVRGLKCGILRLDKKD